MSLSKLSELSRLLLIVDRFYAEENAIAAYGWDFQKQKLQPPDSGDGLARFLCAELSDTFDEGQNQVEQVLTGVSYIEKVIKELQNLIHGMEDYTVNLIVHEFIGWMVSSKRKTFSEGLLKSWIDVHPTDQVRDLEDRVKKRMLELLPSGTELTADNITAMTQTLDKSLEVGIGLEEILKEEVVKEAAPEASKAPEPPAPPATS